MDVLNYESNTDFGMVAQLSAKRVFVDPFLADLVGCRSRRCVFLLVTRGIPRAGVLGNRWIVHLY